MARIALLVLVISLSLGPLCLSAGKAPAAPEAEGRKVSETAAALIRSLDDPDERVRGSAIHGLRLLARRIDVMGGQRTRRGGEFEPKVPGLVPVLAKAAAADKAEVNRVAALYALADTLEPAAAAAIRDRLKDESAKVRLEAACLLTEFQDAAGLAEMKLALKRLRAKPFDMMDSFETETLLASFARITGKSFGDIPMNPSLYGDLRDAQAARDRYRELLDTWAAWWDWTPAGEIDAPPGPRADARYRHQEETGSAGAPHSGQRPGGGAEVVPALRTPRARAGAGTVRACGGGQERLPEAESRAAGLYQRGPSPARPRG